MSTYCDEANMQEIFGPENTERWADLDNDEDDTVIDARIARAIAVASAFIDDYMRGTPYVLPLATSAGVTPTSIEDLAAKLAGVWLYESRGVEDFGKAGQPLHKLTPVRMSVMRELKAIRAGVRKLDAM